MFGPVKDAIHPGRLHHSADSKDLAAIIDKGHCLRQSAKESIEIFLNHESLHSANNYL
jgi:hypothetical protein